MELLFFVIALAIGVALVWSARGRSGSDAIDGGDGWSFFGFSIGGSSEGGDTMAVGGSLGEGGDGGGNGGDGGGNGGDGGGNGGDGGGDGGDGGD